MNTTTRTFFIKVKNILEGSLTLVPIYCSFLSDAAATTFNTFRVRSKKGQLRDGSLVSGLFLFRLVSLGTRQLREWAKGSQDFITIRLAAGSDSDLSPSIRNGYNPKRREERKTESGLWKQGFCMVNQGT